MKLFYRVKNRYLTFRLHVRRCGLLLPVLFGLTGASAVIVSGLFSIGCRYELLLTRPRFVLPFPLLFVLSVPVAFAASFSLGGFESYRCETLRAERYRAWLLFAVQCAAVLLSAPLLFRCCLPLPALLLLVLVFCLEIAERRYLALLPEKPTFFATVCLFWCGYLLFCMLGILIVTSL